MSKTERGVCEAIGCQLSVVLAGQRSRDAEIQQLRGRHATTHVPTLERIKRAHTAMPLSTWASDETAQHRTYYQSDNEQCYLCALIIQLEAAEKVASEREKELSRLRSALEQSLALQSHYA